MDVCSAVEKEVDKVLSKFTSFSDKSSLNFKSLYTNIDSLQKELVQLENQGDGGEDISEAKAVILSQAIGCAKDTVTKLSTEHRDLHSSVSKVGKAIDKNFTSDFICVSNEYFLNGDRQQLINEVIVQHFFREGLMDVSEILIKESGVNLQDEDRAPFFELNRILESLKSHDLQPALEWGQKNREKLQARKSSLEFKLHRLAYISLVSEGPQHILSAIEYARTHLTSYVQQHEKAIQSLLGCLLYVKSGLENSPYSELLSPNQWNEICEVFKRDACALLGLSVDSPLAVCIGAGCTALPVLLNIKQVMQQQQVHSMWNTKEELPIEIKLGPSCCYHSIFACPILRQQSTENNPPMRLMCGHIISRDALNKLASGNKLKCPYCPVEQSPSDATHIYF